MDLAGDIGGTNTRLALFENGKMVGEEKKFPSQKYDSLETIIAEFLHGKKVGRACFGVAGPVREGRAKITNLTWVVDASKIAKECGIGEVKILNDLEANAHGIRVLRQDEFHVLQKGKEQKGNQALIAAGTGLGEAGLFWDGNAHLPFACEGGHTDFGPRDEMEVELLGFLKKKFGHVSYERVVSGPGIHELFQFLVETKRFAFSQKIQKAMKEKDPSRVITEEKEDPACLKAVEWFVSLYGAECGNAALKFLALGGVFIGGGIAPHLIQRMGGFVEAFVDKGRFRDLLASIPIRVILNDNAALLGAGNWFCR